MKILVTGGNGFLGRPTVRLLASAGHEVHVADAAPAAPVPGVTAHVADLHTAGAELIASVRPSHLLHLAWHVPPGEFWTSAENLRWLNTSVELFRAFAAAGGRRWIGAGTCAEYDWSEGGIFAEEAPVRPATLYGAAKASVHLLVGRLGAQLRVETAWARIFFPYGPGEPAARLVPSVIAALRRGERARTTAGTQLRDFVFVEDVASAFAGLAESSFTGAVNLGTGQAVPVRRIVGTIAELLGRTDLLDLGALPTRPGEPECIVADVTRLTGLGLAPRHSLEEGLAISADLRQLGA